MERSLSILLPVRNAQATLSRSISRLLDAAEQLTERFEILIVDEGSTDQTEEVALELATCYPQIGVLRNQDPQGLVGVIRAGLARTSGEIVCLHEGAGEVDIADLRALWHLREDEDLVLARQDRQSERGAARPMPAAAGKPIAGSGLQMLRRESLGALQSGVPLAAAGEQVRVQRTDDAIATDQGPRRPNFLTRLRNLTLGE